MRKQNIYEKQSKCSVKYISYSRRITWWSSLITGSPYLLYMGLFTLCSYLKTKEYYDRWVTRRVWGFRHQISKAKNLKMSVTNIGKLQEKSVALCKMAAKFLQQKDNIFAAQVDFAAVKKFPSALSDILAMAVTPSFQLRIIHHLKHWIFDFLSFETTYRMHKLNSRKCSKSGWHDCHQECFMADFSLLPLLAFRICLWQRTSKLRFFMFMSFPLLFHGFQITLLNIGLLWWSKSYQNTKT